MVGADRPHDARQVTWPERFNHVIVSGERKGFRKHCPHGLDSIEYAHELDGDVPREIVPIFRTVQMVL